MEPCPPGGEGFALDQIATYQVDNGSECTQTRMRRGGPNTFESQTNYPTNLALLSPECGTCEFYNFTFAPPVASLTVRPKVIINVPSTARDGDTVTFSVTTTDGTPSAYQWSFTFPSNAGNNPYVNFSAPTAASTTAEAHWFALPNSDCATSPPPPSSSHPYYNSRYNIKVKVTFPDGYEKTKDADFSVNGWWDPAGSVAPATNSGGIAIQLDPATQRWVVAGPGTMTRGTYPAVINIPLTSQFHNKTVQHEAKHVLQWQSGIFQNIRAVSGFMAVIQNYSDTSAARLQQQINQAFLNWDAQQAQNYANDLSAAEIEAFAISDLLTPQYAYQRCGRTTWP